MVFPLSVLQRFLWDVSFSRLHLQQTQQVLRDWTFACLCFKTSTLNPNFQFTCCTASLCPVFKVDLSLVSINTEVGIKPPPWMLRFGQGRHPLMIGRRQAPPAQIMFTIITAFRSSLLLPPPLFMDRVFQVLLFLSQTSSGCHSKCQNDGPGVKHKCLE